MSEARNPPIRLSFWQLFFWLALGTVTVVAPLAILFRDQPLFQPFFGLAVGAFVVVYRRRRSQQDPRL